MGLEISKDDGISKPDSALLESEYVMQPILNHHEQVEPLIDAMLNAPVVRRVEVDLSGWLAQLTDVHHWEVVHEAESEHCIEFGLLAAGKTHRSEKWAEVTLYHNGYAIVEVNGEPLFDGKLTTETSECAHLSYYHAESGEPIVLN